MARRLLILMRLRLLPHPTFNLERAGGGGGGGGFSHVCEVTFEEVLLAQFLQSLEHLDNLFVLHFQDQEKEREKHRLELDYFHYYNLGIQYITSLAALG